jgi:hypothetical protein
MDIIQEMKQLFVLIISVFVLTECKAETINGIRISLSGTRVKIENKLISLRFDLNTGTYAAFDKVRKTEAIYNASTHVDDFYSSDKGVINTYVIKAVDEKLGRGAALLITSKKYNCPDQLFEITLFNNKGFITLKSGIRNNLKGSYRVVKLSPVAGASIFKGADLKKNFRLLDGEGGGAETFIRKEPFLLSQNNLLLNFGAENDRHSLIAGGLTYQEFEKFASIQDGRSRAKELAALAGDLSFLEYIDAGNANFWSKTTYCTVDKIGKIFNISYAGGVPEAKSIVYDKSELRIYLKSLQPSKTYSLGLTFGAYDSTIVQSLRLLDGDTDEEILAPVRLPNLPAGDDPQLYFIAITPEMLKKGMPTIVVKKERGSNCILNELILLEGKVDKDKIATPLSAKSTWTPEYNDVKLDLYAEDPVGRLLQPGQTYLPSKDAFYLDFSTTNPLEAAENYATTVKVAQTVELNHYYFPTVCLWYAMQPHYGGTDPHLRSINDTHGAVEEMERVKRSGWLKYTTMGIRLVPDCYAKNNENGWWDDKHWQLHGSGDEKSQGGKGMELQEGHYRKPFETSRKWAKAIIDRGGLPFTYFQTGVRSEDYCKQYPQHMLHNQSYYKVDGQLDRFNGNFGSYDFTDTSFTTHMKAVYKNLHHAGIVGMMFDYPHTAWAHYGGMDNQYATTASHYRKVFELASAGLGKRSYVQERNLTRGSDINLGIVESQRIWGDTDGLNAEMVMRGGLRWYKNRVLFNYDMDAKSLTKAVPSDSDDGINKLLTMSYITASRLLLGQSFAKLNAKEVYQLSRVFPYHQSPQSAEPVDAFASDYPRVYDFKVNDAWHQLTFFNEDDQHSKKLSIDLSGTPGFGGVGLNKNKTYYIYDFWNKQFIGEFKGDEILSQELRKGEARMMSVREKANVPQVLSTDRHVMQGFVELSDIKWSNNKLSGKAEMVENEPMKIIIATNGKLPKKVELANGTSSFKILDKGLMELTITSPQGGKADWAIGY